jgi:hypothetical protein
MGEGYNIEMADAARPKDFRDYFFANVEFLRSLMRTASEAAAIDEKGLAVGGDEKDRVALAYVNGFH